MKILLAALLGAVSTAATAQMSAPPPVKMGLWETTANMKMSGMDLPPGMEKMAGMGNRTTVIRSCFTPESWQKAVSQSRDQRDCTRTNESMTPVKYSFDMTCSKGKTSGHFEMFFDSKEKAHSTMSMEMNAGSAHPIHTDSTSTSTFVGADCGTITPDKPQIVSR